MAVSFTWIVNVKVPVAESGPLIAPVAVFKLRPVGNAPTETLHVSAPGFPPCTAIRAL